MDSRPIDLLAHNLWKQQERSSVQQVHPLDPLTGQLPPAQAGVGGDQDQRPEPPGDGSAKAATWATVAKRISGAPR